MIIAKKYTILSLTGVILCASIAGAIAWKFQSNSNSEVKGESTVAAKAPLQFTNEKFGFSFLYDSDFAPKQLTKQDIKDNFLSYLESRNQPNQAMVTVKKEEKLKLVSSFSGKPILEVMLTNAAKSLPITYPEYNEIRQQQFSFAGVNAAEIYFTYKATNGDRAKVHLIMLLRNQDEAIVFSFHALETDFDRLDTLYFKPIKDSIKFE